MSRQKEKRKLSVMETGKFPLKSYLINYKSTLRRNSVYILGAFPFSLMFFWMSMCRGGGENVVSPFHFLSLSVLCFAHFPISFSSSSLFYTGSNYFNCGNRAERHERETFQLRYTYFCLLSWLSSRRRHSIERKRQSFFLAEKKHPKLISFLAESEMELKENR